jgi:putative transposase
MSLFLAMARIARVVVPDVPHHVTQRGNRGVQVFLTPDDHQRYLLWLADYASRAGLKVWAYCLMPNHVHLVVVPSRLESIAQVLGPLHMRYSQRINLRHSWSGHLWQARYYSCPLDDAHLWHAVRYVERNPVRAGITPVAEAYPWSSASAHAGLRIDPVLANDLPFQHEIEDWPSWLRGEEARQQVENIRTSTRKGMPCGGEEFVSRISSVLGRILSPSPRGRPRKQ